jgi:hypothetical protein
LQVEVRVVKKVARVEALLAALVVEVVIME